MNLFGRLPKNLKIALAIIFSFGLTLFLSKTIFLYGSPRVNLNYIASFVQKAENFLAGALGRGNPTVNVTQAPVTGVQTGAIFMSWYYCPPDGRTCIPQDWYAVPPGVNSPYADGSHYNPDNYLWWYLEASDMTCAGLDIAYVYIWDNPNNQYTNKVGNLGNAINQLKSSLKVAEFWDASYASNDGGPVDLSSPDTAQYRYNKFIKPFYQVIPQALWANQNGQPILAVYRFGSDTYTNVEKADVFFTNIKNLFKTDFNVEPLLILGSEWYEKTSAKNAADGEFDVFNSGITRDGNARTHTTGNLTISNISAGGNDYRSFGSHLDRQDGQVLKNEFGQVPKNANLLMVESWNELGEGSGIERATYPKSGGGQLSTTTVYMDILRDLLKKSDRGDCLNLQNIIPQTTPTTTPPANATTAPAATSTPVPISSSTTITVNPQIPSANSSFKVNVSSSTGYTWVHLNIFDSAGTNVVWIAPTNGTQPTISKSAGKITWTYSVGGLPAGKYQIYFYINCDVVYPHCQQAPFTAPFAKTNLTVQ